MIYMHGIIVIALRRCCRISKNSPPPPRLRRTSKKSKTKIINKTKIIKMINLVMTSNKNRVVTKINNRVMTNQVRIKKISREMISSNNKIKKTMGQMKSPKVTREMMLKMVTKMHKEKSMGISNNAKKSPQIIKSGMVSMSLIKNRTVHKASEISSKVMNTTELLKNKIKLIIKLM